MYKRIVVKLGTSVLTSGSRQFDQSRMVDLARQCAELQRRGHEMIVTSSGAMAAGRTRLGHPALPPSIVTKQLFAAVGQPRLMALWERFFDIYGIEVAQILLTRADVNDRRRYLNARDTFTALIEQCIIPIVNENDAVATEEIRVGDNDNLSALVASLINADLLLLLTDQAGLYTADPRTNPRAELISEVHVIDDNLRALAGGTNTGLGTGGMATKLQAANIARRSGAEVVICAGSEPNVITRAAAGDTVGTRFPALETPLESRKRWILAGPRPAGRLTIDAGAVHALSKAGSSLLPAGIRRVDGEFQRGDTVAILDAQQREVARGITAYGSEQLRQIAGQHSDRIEERLGYTYGPAVVHRNNMTLLAE